MTDRFMTVEDALIIVWDIANQNKLTKAYTLDDPEMEPERQRQEIALDTIRDFFVNVVSERRSLEQAQFGPFFVDYMGDEYLPVDVAGNATVQIKIEDEGIVVDVYPTLPAREPAGTIGLTWEDIQEVVEE